MVAALQKTAASLLALSLYFLNSTSISASNLEHSEPGRDLSDENGFQIVVCRANEIT
jgi:hypothetical protein